MGFTLQDFEDAAARKYAGLDIDDAPGGPLKIRSVLRLSSDETKQVQAVQKELETLQESEDADNETVRLRIVQLLDVLADRKDVIQPLLGDKDLAVVISIYEAYG